MDFSEAKCSGFSSSFITFGMMHSDNSCTHQQLQITDKHFCAGVTYVSHISGAVEHRMKEEFSKWALALLDAPDSQEFIAHAELLV